MLIAMAGIVRGSAILIVGSMIVVPDFSPVAGICVATVGRRRDLAVRSLTAQLTGFATGITASILVALVLRLLGAFPGHLLETPQHLPQAVSDVGAPGFFTFFMAFAAGIAGMLSLSTAKFGVLIGVLVSVTTIPAAANLAITLSRHRNLVYRREESHDTRLPVVRYSARRPEIHAIKPRDRHDV